MRVFHWLSILEASFVIFRLPPYYRNFGKHLVKSPKIYFTEPGLACWLLGIESAMTWHRELAANVLKFQRDVAEVKSGFILYAGDFFPETDHYTARHFKDTCDCLMVIADR